MCNETTEITTTQAGDFLHVSRPYFVSTIKRGELPTQLGRHAAPGDQGSQLLLDLLERATAMTVDDLDSHGESACRK